MNGVQQRLPLSCVARCEIAGLCDRGLRTGEFVFDDAIFAERGSRVQSVRSAMRLFSEPLPACADEDHRAAVARAPGNPLNQHILRALPTQTEADPK